MKKLTTKQAVANLLVGSATVAGRDMGRTNNGTAYADPAAGLGTVDLSTVVAWGVVQNYGRAARQVAVRCANGAEHVLYAKDNTPAQAMRFAAIVRSVPRLGPGVHYVE